MAGPRRKAPLTRTQALAGYLEKTLLPDLRLRAAEAAVAAVLAERWSYERAQKRTAAALPEWTDQTLTQVAVAWVLSAVFVRVLEDRGLVAQRRIAGGDATDSERLFYEMFAGLGARDYLAAVFNEVAHAPVLRDLLGPSGNPAWKLGPSHAAVLALFTLLRDADATGALTWRFDDADTRFLGDLYEDLSAEVRERFAMRQTPDFVERFILDRTLDPAVAEFGLAEVRVIDPTCGSGHFLLGSFGRLVRWMREARPADDLRDVACEALKRIYGSDINPYAVAIARFRLLLAYTDVCGVTRVTDAPMLPSLTRNIVVADSLLLGAEGSGQLMELALDASAQATWGPSAFDFVDPPAVKHVFRQRYHAVVGNPPYKVCPDAALRETYRRGYPDSATGQYALAAPFTERFFKIALDGGFVGLINANTFMKRNFGKGLIERSLPRLDLTSVIDTSGAYIPGHPTPTVILFGRHQPPMATTVRVVMGRRGEPEAPAVPAQGRVWSSIAANDRHGGFENEFITVVDVPRAILNKHRWSFGGGGAGDLKETIEETSERTLGAMLADSGRGAATQEDELFSLAPGAANRWGISPEALAEEGTGEQLRDWAFTSNNSIVFPYHRDGVLDSSRLGRYHEIFWQQRTNSWTRAGKGFKTIRALKYEHYQYGMFYWRRFYVPLKIAYAFVATHNHFVLDRGGKVFRQSGLLLILTDSATENDYFSLLAWLNSSTACFWMKQECHKQSSASQAHHSDPSRATYQFPTTPIKTMPVPRLDEHVGNASKRLNDLCEHRASWIGGKLVRQSLLSGLSSASALRALFQSGWRECDDARDQAVYLQDEIDWHFYATLGMCSHEEANVDFDSGTRTPPGCRPFEIDTGYDEGLSERAKGANRPQVQKLPERWKNRADLVSRDGIRVVETRQYKRQWRDTETNVDQSQWRHQQEHVWVERFLEEQLEAAMTTSNACLTSSDICHELQQSTSRDSIMACIEWLDDTIDSVVRRLCEGDSIPYLAALRHTDTGLAKRARWEHTWALQRREDAGDTTVGDIPVPPKYDHEDYREARYWSLRGKLDVPRERFIAYPGAELDARAPVFGWAGWNHLQRARALAALYQRRKTDDGWDRDRLRPLLAGLQELLPWLKQWHNEPDAELDGLRQGDVWGEFLEGERAALGWSEDDLRAWRPSAPARKERAKKAPKAKAAKAEEAE